MISKMASKLKISQNIVGLCTCDCNVKKAKCNQQNFLILKMSFLYYVNVLDPRCGICKITVQAYH